MTRIPAEGDEVLSRIQARREHVWPLHRVMAELDPGFLEIFDEAYVYSLGIDLDPERVRSTFVIVNSYVHAPAP